LQAAYKMEIFTQGLEFRSVSTMARPNIQFDYLTLESTSIEVPSIIAQKGDYARISTVSGEPFYQGIVADIQEKKDGQKLKLLPLLSLLDVPVYYDRRILQNGSLENFLATVIRDTYQNNTDTLQNLPGIEVDVFSQTMKTKLNIKSNVHEFWDIAVKALTMYDIVINVQLDIGRKKLRFTIGKAVDNLHVLESNLPNCIEKNMVMSDRYGEINKSTYIKSEDETQKITYYLYEDGTIGTQDKDRITPVFFSVEYIEGSEDFEQDALNRATEQLLPQKYEQLIELSFWEGDPLMEPNTWRIGDQGAIYIGDKVYTSILTGFESKNGIKTLIFGSIRMELTKKLVLERRKDA